MSALYISKTEPNDETILSARIARAYPYLPSAYTAARIATVVCLLERKLRRVSEKWCNGECDEQHYDRERSRIVNDVISAAEAIKLNATMDVQTNADPRGPVLLLRLAGENEYVTV